MSFHHAIRITLSYDDCSGIIQRWADRCSQVVVYQHDADEEISKTHVHLGLYGCEVKAEQLKRMWPDAPGKGNEFWSWKPATLETPTILTEPARSEGVKYITYMSKGTLRPKFVKNISQDILESARLSWVEPVKAGKSGDNSERVIKRVIDKIKSEFVYHRLTDDEIVDRVECRAETLCKLVRKEAFRQLWGEHSRVPHASHYKIVAGTSFMRLCEHYECFEEGLEVIQNLWY